MSPLELNPFLARLPPYVFSELDRRKIVARARGMQLIDLGIGSPDQPMAPEIPEALAAALRDVSIHGYPPFSGVPSFLESCARFMHTRFGVRIDPQREALALSGAKEGIAHLIFALCGAGDIVLVPEIYYPVYARAAWLCGAEAVWVPMREGDRFVLDLNAIPESAARKAKLLIVNYPNNPTGARADRAFYERAVEFARAHDLLLVSDLAYSELTFEGGPAPSALEVPGAGEVTIEFHSGSKMFSMAGLRMGFTVGNAAAVRAMYDYRTNIGYGSPSAVQLAMGYALDHYKELIPPKVAEYRRRRDALVHELRAAGWDVQPPAGAMYAWLRVPAGVEDWEWVQRLIDRAGTVVTPGIAFGQGGKGYFRVSLVRDAETLRMAAKEIARAAADKGA
jgi:LL-diaminopimelate aminotransferase